MDEVQDQIETLIDDVERDETITKTDIVVSINRNKS